MCFMSRRKTWRWENHIILTHYKSNLILFFIDEKRNFKLISSIHLYSIEPSSINDSSYFSGVSQRIQQEYDENLNDEKREIYGMIKAPKTLQVCIIFYIDFFKKYY